MTTSEILIIVAIVALLVLVIKKLKIGSFSSDNIFSRRTRKKFLSKSGILRIVVVLGLLFFLNYVLYLIVPHELLYSTKTWIVRAGLAITAIAFLMNWIGSAVVLSLLTMVVLVFSIREYDQSNNNGRGNDGENNSAANLYVGYNLIVFPPLAEPGEEQMWSDDIETKLGFRPTFLKPLVDPENPLKIRLVTSKGYIDLCTNDPDFAEKFYNISAIRIRGHALGENPVKNHWKYIPE